MVAPNKQRLTSCESAQNSAVCESWVLETAGLLYSLVEWKAPCPWQARWMQMIFKISSNSNNSVILTYWKHQLKKVSGMKFNSLTYIWEIRKIPDGLWFMNQSQQFSYFLELLKKYSSLLMELSVNIFPEIQKDYHNHFIVATSQYTSRSSATSGSGRACRICPNKFLTQFMPIWN